MAVVKQPQSSCLQIKVQTGVNASGAPTFRLRSLKNLKALAADAAIYAIGKALGALQDHGVVAISRQDQANLSEE